MCTCQHAWMHCVDTQHKNKPQGEGGGPEPGTYIPRIPFETASNTQIVWLLEVTHIYLHHFMYLSGTPEEVIYIYLHHFTYLSGAPEGVIYIYLHHFMYPSGTPEKSTTETINIERKLRSTKVRLFTVPCCSIILFSSEGMNKKRILTYSFFFRHSIILVCSIIEFSQFSHIYQFGSIII